MGLLAGVPPFVELDLRAAPVSSVGFSRFDLKSGMSYSYGFALADFDCDGRSDISFFDSFTPDRDALRRDRGAVGYLQWNGGELEQIRSSDTYPELSAPANGMVLFERQVAVDVNGDGLLDIAGVVNSHAAVVAYINPGARDRRWDRQILSMSTPGAVNIATGDVDGDGLPDLLVALRAQPSTDPDPVVKGVVWLRNPGARGAPWVQSQIQSSEELGDVRTLAAADFDRDGRLDVMVSDNPSGKLLWFRQTTGTHQWIRREIPGVLAAHGHYGIVQDMDGDGFLDVLQPTYQGIVWVRNVDGAGSWQPLPLARFAKESMQLIVSELTTGDVDMDGRMDILFVISSLSSSPTEPRRGGLYWLRQGDAGWELNQILRSDSAIVGIKVLDYDGDGDLDVVTNGEFQANVVTIWINALR
jgi:hypothetical protein